MTPSPSTAGSDTTNGAGLYRLGQVGLASTFALVLALVGWGVTKGPEVLLVLAALALMGFGAMGFVGRPLLRLGAVLAGFVLVLNYTEGIQLSEAAFGVCYVGYLAGWFLFRDRAHPLLRTRTDLFALGFLLYLTASLALLPFTGGGTVTALNQWRVMLVLAFFFPIRDAIARDDRAVVVIAAVFVFVALFVVGRNFMRYLAGFQSVSALWEILLNRVRQGERVVMVSMLGSILALLTVDLRRWVRAGLLGIIGLQAVALLLGQSRATWLATLLGLGLVTLALPGRQRLRLLLASVGILALAYGLASLFIGDLVSFLVAQYQHRASTIGTAATSDPSLVNRFYEWRTVLEYIRERPVFGYGFGVPYRFYSLLYEGTEVKYFSHSTYLTQLYRHGIVGLGLLVGLVGSSIVGGYRIARHPDRTALEGAIGLGAAIGLLAVALAGTMESVLSVTDGVYVLAIPLGVIAGIRERLRQRGAALPPTS